MLYYRADESGNTPDVAPSRRVAFAIGEVYYSGVTRVRERIDERQSAGRSVAFEVESSKKSGQEWPSESLVSAIPCWKAT